MYSQLPTNSRLAITSTGKTMSRPPKLAINTGSSSFKSADLKELDPVLIASFGGRDMVLPVDVMARREFVGSWEYMLTDAIFTSPPHPAWSGAALINHKGELVGVGSLVVGDTSGKGDGHVGNMFVPIDALPPILAD